MLEFAFCCISLRLATRSHILKTAAYRLEAVSLSESGRVRAVNEDAAAVDHEYGIAVVADGMGGHRAGDVASRMAIDRVLGRLRAALGRFSAGVPQPAALPLAEQAIAEANSAIHAAAHPQSGRSGMGTTLALAFFHGEQVALAHVGDSRIYRLRSGRLQLLTRDDSLLHDQIELGVIAAEDAADSHNRHLIVDSPKTNLPLAASHLAQLANDNGGYDNITVALVRVLADEAGAGARGWISRLLGRLMPGKAER